MARDHMPKRKFYHMIRERGTIHKCKTQDLTIGYLHSIFHLIWASFIVANGERVVLWRKLSFVINSHGGFGKSKRVQSCPKI